MIRFFNGRILTMDGPDGISSGEVWTKDDKIVHVGPAPEKLPVFDRQIDLNGNLLMPGFKNAHTHSAMTFLRSFADDLPLHTWLYDKVFPLEARLRPEHIYYMAKLAIMEYLTGGITSSFDMYYHLDAYAQANIDCGFRTVICGAVMSDEKYVMENEYARYNNLHPLISYRLGFHAEYTATLDCLRNISEIAHQFRQPVYSHNSETRAEVDGCLERYAMTPTALFDSLGLFDYGGGGFHCTHMTDSDLDIFRDRGLYAVTNPASNAKLASGIAPITRMMSHGVRLAVGTDGPASNNALDMFREMYLVCVLQKLAENDAAACNADQVLQMATVGGAHAMGLRDCDVIAPGKQADLIVIDMHRPNMQPVHNITKNIVYSGTRDNVRLTMVAGKVLYEDGEFFIGEDPEAVYGRIAEILPELTG